MHIARRGNVDHSSDCAHNTTTESWSIALCVATPCATGQHGGVARRDSSDPHADARNSEHRYDQSGEPVVLEPGDRFFVRCEGGPSTSRLEVFPPRLEVEETDGIYVLEDDGPREH